MKDFNAQLLSQLIEKFHQKYELKVGYAEFLVKQMLDPETDDFCVYGCLACLAKFGPFINRKILLPHIPTINALMRTRLDANSFTESRPQTMLDIDANIQD